MFKVHNVNNNTISIKNLILLFLTIVMGFGSVITLAQISIPSSIDNAWQTIKRVTITSDGTDSGTILRDFNDDTDRTYITGLIDQGNFSGKVLGIDENGYLVYSYSTSLVVSGVSGGGGDTHWSGDNAAHIRNLNAGKVGIGAAPTSGKLHIIGSGDTDVYIEELEVNKAANINFKNTTRTRTIGGDSFPDIFYIGIPGINQFISIIPTGEVGIGTTGPKATLQAVGNVIAGDYSNDIINSNRSAIIGGTSNSINDETYSIIGGGSTNQIYGGGRLNAIIGGIGVIIGTGSSQSFIGGGNYNTIHASTSTTIGGSYNNINGGDDNTIGGGNYNTITGSSLRSVILGGRYNIISGAIDSVVGGYRSYALHSNSFVRNAGTNPFQTTKRNTFIIYAPIEDDPDSGGIMGGVGINKANPTASLDVNGNIASNSTIAGSTITATYEVTANEVTAKNFKINSQSTGSTCNNTSRGTIIMSGNNFYGCDGNTRKKLDN